MNGRLQKVDDETRHEGGSRSNHIAVAFPYLIG